MSAEEKRLRKKISKISKRLKTLEERMGVTSSKDHEMASFLGMGGPMQASMPGMGGMGMQGMMPGMGGQIQTRAQNVGTGMYGMGMMGGDISKNQPNNVGGKQESAFYSDAPETITQTSAQAPMSGGGIVEDFINPFIGMQ